MRKFFTPNPSYVDIFLPSIDELVYMIGRENFAQFDKSLNNGVPLGGVSREKLDEYSEKLIKLGSAIVVIKLHQELGNVYISHSLS